MLLLSILAPPCVSSAQAQGSNSGITIAGHVSGPRSPSAYLITIRNDSQGISWTFLSSAAGDFRLSGVPVGDYEVSVHHDGKVSSVREDALVGNHRFDIVLEDRNARDVARTNADLLARFPWGERGFELLQYHCIQCHGLEFIVAARKSAQEWQITVDRMIARVPAPPAGEAAEIASYFARHFDGRTTGIPLHGRRSYSFDATAVMVQLDLPDPAAHPHDIELGPDRKLWVSDFHVTNEPGHKNIFVVDPGTLAIEVAQLPIEMRSGVRSIEFDRQGTAWLTMPFDNRLLRVRSLAETPREFPVTGDSWPHSAAISLDGKIWLTGMKSDTISRLDPESGTIRDYLAPTRHAMNYSIAAAHDGTVWFTGLFSHRLTKFDPQAGKFTEYETPIALSSPRYLRIGRDGDIWIALFAAGRIARFDQKTENFSEYSLIDRYSAPYDLAISDSDAIWFTDFNRDAVSRLDPATGRVTEFSIPLDAHAAPTEITIDHEGRIWFCENARSRVSFVSPKAIRTPGVYFHRDADGAK